MITDLDRIDVFPWTENFATGIDTIDQQHQQLVKLLNELACTLADDNHLEIKRVFDELAAYANHHFETEEAIWDEVFPKDDPWLVSHHGSHDHFLPAVVQMQERDKHKPMAVVIEDVVKFLIRWLAFHIVAEDMRMAMAVKAYRQGKSLDEAKIYSEEQMEGFATVLVDAVLNMYDSLSSRTMELMRERVQRKKVERQLRDLNAELESQSITDQLTGLYNRRYFDQILDRELKRCQRETRPLTLMMMDIDYFKLLNDHYGHVKGDEALQQISECLQWHCHRPGDFCFRIGGEEFAFVIENPECETGLVYADTIRQAIEGLNIPHAKSAISECVTVSIGVVSRVPAQGDSTDSLLREADSFLYRAKSSGRNRVAF
ncbi:MAG: GGDEF domain-containing protein [Candidatus Pelagadaptatus aseana]|uniref:GGDEF domain-containing protein n=1 Tax=Candidatus Pelagadaptatus aseana TaxID=3120508 RepID=UPI0039B1FF34